VTRPARHRKRFSPNVYASIIERQRGRCGCGCREKLGDDPRQIEFDHVLGLEEGGPDTPGNLRAVKKKHHLEITKAQTKRRAKVKRIKERDGLRKSKLSQRDKALAKILEKRT